MFHKPKPYLLAAIAVATALTSIRAQTASTHWILSYSGPNQPLTSEYISEPGTMTGVLLGGGAFTETGASYAWMEAINNVVGAPEYSAGTNTGTLNFKIDRIDFDIDTSITAIVSSDFIFDAEGSSNALLDFTIGRYNSSGLLQQQTNFIDRGYAEGTGTNRTSTPWELTLNPGDFLRVIGGTLRLNATTWDLNSNGVENSGDVFSSRVVASFGLKIETDADFTSELGGLYTGAMPLSIPEPSTYALIIFGAGLASFIYCLLYLLPPLSTAAASELRRVDYSGNTELVPLNSPSWSEDSLRPCGAHGPIMAVNEGDL